MFRFVANLKPYTFHRGRGIQKFDYYLLSTDYSSGHRSLVRKVHKANRALVADNGNFDLIGDLIHAFKPQVLPLQDRRREIEVKLGEKLTARNIPDKLRREFLALASEVSRAARSHNDDSRLQAINDQQEALSPRYRIGAEDLTLATLSGLRIEAGWLGWDGENTAPYSRFPIEFCQRVNLGEFGEVTGQVYTGLHGMDHDTAWTAGRLAAEANCQALSTGLGAALSDRGYTRQWVRHGQTQSLDQMVPRAYLRFAELISGFFSGYHSVNQTLPDFHALGLGTPIMLVLLGALNRPGVDVHADSTAPIKDAGISRTISLYVHKPAPLKLKSHRIAEHWLKHDLPWSPKSAKSRRFNEEHPAQLDKARAWWRREGERRLQSSDFSKGSVLSDCLPLLGRASDPDIRKKATRARIHHNHWVIRQLQKAINKHENDIDSLHAYVSDCVNQYLSTPHADSRWKAAVNAAWTIIRQSSVFD